MRQRELRRLLIAGALAEVSQALRRDKTGGSRLTCVLELKRRKAATVALANRMQRIVWALMTKKEVYRASAVA